MCFKQWHTQTHTHSCTCTPTLTHKKIFTKQLASSLESNIISIEIKNARLQQLTWNTNSPPKIPSRRESLSQPPTEKANVSELSEKNTTPKSNSLKRKNTIPNTSNKRMKSDHILEVGPAHRRRLSWQCTI